MLESTPHDALTATPIARGWLREGQQKDKESIILHMESHHPALPLYQRVHAPNRRYLLASSLSKGCKMITMLKMQHLNCDTAHIRVLTELNISFAKLPTEECWLLELKTALLCKKCTSRDDHFLQSRAKYTQWKSRKPARLHAKPVKSRHTMSWWKRKQDQLMEKKAKMFSPVWWWGPLTSKLIMLPIMPGRKTVCFTKRIISIGFGVGS